MLKKFDRARYDALLYRDFSVHYGKVNKVVGLTVESVGPPAKLNDLEVAQLGNWAMQEEYEDGYARGSSQGTIKQQLGFLFIVGTVGL